MSVIARFWSAAAQAGLAEAAWHWLGPAWAFGLAVLLIAWHLPAAVMPASGAAMEKARAVEHRLNALVAQIPAPQATPGPHSDSTYSGSNTSYSAGNSSYGASNTSYGAHTLTNTQTGTQQGSGTSHYHYTQVQSDFNDLVASVNSIRDSHSDLVPCVNALRQSHSDLVPAVNALRQSHSDLVPLVNTLVGGHQNLTSKANTLISRLEQSGILQ